MGVAEFQSTRRRKTGSPARENSSDIAIFSQVISASPFKTSFTVCLIMSSNMLCHC